MAAYSRRGAIGALGRRVQSAEPGTASAGPVVRALLWPPPTRATEVTITAVTAAAASTGLPIVRARCRRCRTRALRPAAGTLICDGGWSVSASSVNSVLRSSSSMAGHLVRAVGPARWPSRGGLAGSSGLRAARQDAPEGGKRFGRLTLDRAGSTAEHLSRLGYVEVAVIPEHQHGALARREGRHRSLQVQQRIQVGRRGPDLRRLAGHAYPPCPARSPTPDKLPDQDGANISIGAVRRGGPVPVLTQLGQRCLDEVVGVVPVPAQQQGQPPQRRDAGSRVFGELIAVRRGHNRSRQEMVITLV